MAIEEKAVNLPQTQPVEIAVNEATAPTVIGDRAQVHYHNIVNTMTIVTSTSASTGNFLVYNFLELRRV